MIRYAVAVSVFGGSIFFARFARLDRNDDGEMTQEEAGTIWSRLQPADTDGDGGITIDEARAKFGGGR